MLLHTKHRSALSVSDELLLDYNPVTGMREWISTDEDGNSFIRYEQDVSAVLDHNKEMQANNDLDRRSDMWLAARLTDGIMLEWKSKHGIEAWNPDHAEGVKRLLNSNEYRYLRVNNFIM